MLIGKLHSLAALSLACALAVDAGADVSPDLAAILASLPPGIRGAPGSPAAASAPGASALDGLEIEYTIDPELDLRVRRVLARGRVALGHVILMDPATGEVFSYVSTDPQGFPATRAYPTASLMKVVTAAAVLRHAPRAARRDCRYVGSPYELRPASLRAPSAGGRIASFGRSLALSNNQCFARLAIHDVGEEALLDEMRRVGLFEAPAARHPAGRADPVRGELALGSLGSGLAGSFITPLAAVRLAALLARGELVRPNWIARVRDASGSVLAVPGSPKPRRVWSTEVAGELRELLVGVTTRGTARSAFRDAHGEPLLGALRVAGKTGSLSGTAPDGRYQWFIGVAPAEAPRIAIAVLVVNGPIWWSSAADVAAATLREVFCGDDSCDGGAVEQLHARAEPALAAAPGPAAEEERGIREASELDQPLRPVGVTGMELPAALRTSKARGEIVLLLYLDSEGQVLDARVDSSDLPQLDAFVTSQVRSWTFTPPTWRGHPVEARARLPIPIDIH